MSSIEDLARTLVHDARLYAPREIERYPACLPNREGVYAWFFDGIDAEWSQHCVTREGRRLLYVGISSGRGQSLRGRIIQRHLRGTADVSTLRQSLGANATTARACARVVSGFV